MKRTVFLIPLIIIVIGISAHSWAQSASATYTLGDLPTTRESDANITPQSNAIEPGELTVTIPAGVVIESVDVQYSITAHNGGWMSHQRSFLRCVSPGGETEPEVYSGSGTGGVYSYYRYGLDIANNVTTTDVEFELHAFRTFGGSPGDNDTLFNYVNNYTWMVTVNYLDAAYDDDMAAVDIEGPEVININTPATYTVTVRNMGENTQNNYIVQLMKEGGIELDSEVVTVSLDTFEMTSVDLEWTPVVEEETYVYGKVVLDGDQNPANDETGHFDVSVLGDLLTGTYEINPDGTGDYISFSSAIADLLSLGVGGPVIFEVAPGTYQEQLIIPEIPYASAINTVTFSGMGTQDDAVIFFEPDDDNPYIVRLNGAKHIRFDNLTFTIGEGADYGFIFHIQNASEDIEITNSILNNRVATTAHFTTVLVSNSNLAYGAGDSHDILVANNVFNDGFTALRFNGTQTDRLYGIELRDNILNQQYSHAVWLVQNYAPVIEGNIIDIRSEEPVNTLNAGINISGIPGPFLISKNNITNPGRHGIYIMNGETIEAERSGIINNSIGGGFRNTGLLSGGIRISGTVNNLDIHYNSINVDLGDGAALNIRTASVTGLDIRNNSFSYTGQEYGYAMYLTSTATPAILDYNNYYSESPNFVYYGSDMDDLTDLQNVNIPVGNDENSGAGNPVYSSSTDLFPLGIQLWAGATPIPGIEEDIEGNLRDEISPCIGAYEYSAPENDLAAVAIEGPGIAYVGDVTTYTVTLRNMGSNAQDDYTVRLMKEGDVELASQPLTVNLEPNEVIDVSLDWTPSVEEITYVYGQVVLPGDENPDNDETGIIDVEVLSEGLEGIYSINQDGTGDFESFTEAVNALMVLGISGAVTFQVYPGIYTEQLFFDGEIPNASGTDTVTFTGAADNREEVILQFAPAVSEDRYVIRMLDTKHIRFDNLTIEAIDTANWGWTFHIMDGCQDIQITNSQIITDTVSTATDYMGIVISGSATSATAAALNVSGILIENNSITGGNRGISARGESASNNIEGLQIHNNVVELSHHHGIWIYHATAPLIQHNILEIRTTMGTSRGISLSYIYDGFDLSYNTITNAGQYGVHLNMSPATADIPNMIYNNMIGGGFRVGNANGLYINAAHTHVIYNSINMDHGTQAALRTMAAASNFRALNNSFAYTGPSDGYAVYLPHPANILESDYNNYYSGTSENFIYYGGFVNDLSPLQADGHDNNSHIGDPMYLGPMDLHAHGPQLHQRGTPIPGIVDDIDGDPRHPENPCIGADEFTLYDDLAATEITGPVFTEPGEPADYSVTVLNEGENSQLAYSVQLLMAPDETILDQIDIVDEPLEMGEAAVHTLTWIPDTIGEYQLYGKVILDEDENPDNDETPVITVNVMTLEPPLFALPVYPEDEAFNIPVDITFEWAPDEEGPAPDGYMFAYWVAGEEAELEDLGDETEYEAAGLEYDTLYNWQVVPYIILRNNSGEQLSSRIAIRTTGNKPVRENDYLFPEEECPVWTFTTVSEPVLFPPQNLSYEVIEKVNVLLMWEEPETSFPAAELLGYNVYRDNELLNPQLIESDVEEYYDENLPAGSFTYYVTAYYQEGESEPSNEVEVTIEVSTEDDTTISLVTGLLRNYPNPFNPETTIGFTLQEAGYVRIEIFNIKGHKVATIVDEYKEPGTYNVVWDSKTAGRKEAGTGIYFYRMVSGSYSAIRKMILMK